MQLFESLSNLRRDYTKGSFSEKTAKENPFEQFKLWFEEVLAAEMLEPTAFVLSTSTKDGKPSSRVLLLKQFDEKGFVFYTNYDSRKGKEIEENPNAAILFFWDKLERQIRIEGKIEKISEVESDKYFQTRPYTSKLGTWASEQSSPLSSRFKLIRQVAQFMAKYPVNVPLPPNWGGYRLIPDVFEFWQGRESRLHDRLQYNKNENGKWVITRLYP
ncbi:MAG: pyridoxamine 5'-phosphate oxidase [Ignavibacteria bacterium GWB2_35_12]|nr:MAG: pyridoxamine 5'-phosphate oxidase [Ignavibacteria bacterium GWB2_35_12]OGU92390.1 MAG: pyridoxamine 5'-phosphate oxidase [Ignavibacteria bacterium RIFOXYA2_FULL_35_10]OGV22351.1 MAG: pyridoxamine 5'-phosphate oxidase [Ignavibacteria bacterium RIFOXYC2_FULL_35_21]